MATLEELQARIQRLDDIKQIEQLAEDIRLLSGLR